MGYIQRFYREYQCVHDLHRFIVCIAESDIEIFIEKKLFQTVNLKTVEDEVQRQLTRSRKIIEDYISFDADFKTSLVPMSCSIDADDIIKQMCDTTKLADVGPMASVAGGIAQELGMFLLERFGDVDVMIENGGDLFIHSKKERYVLVFAGESVLSNVLKIKIRPNSTPIGICTSAGTIGPSLSFGKADAVVVISKNTYLADAVATRLGNELQTALDIPKTLELGKNIQGVEGILLIIEEKLGVWGNIELV